MAALLTKDALLARRVLVALLSDDKVPPRARIDAARIVLDRAGFVPPRAAPAEAREREPHEMSADELRALIDRLSSQLADKATPVDGQRMPDTAAQAVDFLD